LKRLFLTFILMFFVMISVGSCQSNIEVKPDRDIKIGWDASGDPDVQEYAIFYVQGADTVQFPFTNGTDPYDLWMGEPIYNWSFARTYEHSYSYIPKPMQGITYVRLGVAPINRHTGQLGLIKTLSYCIKIERPDSVTGVKELK